MVVAGALSVTPDRPELLEWNRTEFSEPARVAECMAALVKFLHDMPERTPVLLKDADAAAGGGVKVGSHRNLWH